MKKMNYCDVPTIHSFKGHEAYNLKKIVVAMHGWSSSKLASKIDVLAKECLKNNIGLISMDLPGHGDNTHPLTVANCVRDIGLVVNFARAFGKPVCLYGSSFGGYILANYLIATGEQFDSVALIAPATQMHKNLLERKQVKEFQMPICEKETTLKFINDTQKNDIIKNAHKIKTKLDIIYAEKDTCVDNNDIFEFAKLVPSNLHCVKGAEHWFKGAGELEKFIEILMKIYKA